jgi:phenylalanyl-tRNA synthetase beta chain
MAVDVRADGWQVRPPAFRFDIAVEVDLIEEVARVYGYDRIPDCAGQQSMELGSAPAARISPDRLRATLVQRGYQEAITYSFVDRELDRLFAGNQAGVPLVNPISADLSVMRQGLWPGLVQALVHNLARQQQRVRLFEVGVRFTPTASGLDEELVIAGVAAGPAVPEQWAEPARPVDFFDVKSDLEALLAMAGQAGEYVWESGTHPALHPGRSARILRQGQHLGWIGALHPGLVKAVGLEEAPVLFELAANELMAATLSRYGGLSRFPTVRRDLAVLVAANTPVEHLVAAARTSAGPVIREVVVFDIFAGTHVDAGQKSVALGLILQETSRTLTDADVEKIVGGVVQSLARDCGAKLR